MFREKIHRFIDDFCEYEKYRLPNFVPVGIGVGVGIYFSLSNEPLFSLNICTVILLLLLTIFCKSHRWACGILLTISIGFFAGQLRTKTVNTFMLSHKFDKPINISATVETCEKTEKGMTFIVNDVHRQSKYPSSINKINKLHLTWRGKKALASEKDYQPGDKVSFCVVLSPLTSRAFPQGYDFKKQFYFKGIGARGFITKEPKILERCKQTSFQVFIERLRHGINKKIESQLSGDVAAISKALTTGSKTSIPQKVRDSFARSGIAHILAISGLHMGIIGFFVFWLCRLLLCCAIGRYYNVKKIAAVISWLVVLFYLFISGCSVPSMRAFIMHTLVICAILLNRTALTMRAVAVAATVIILCSPEVILFPSFQMSFGAVIALVAFYERAWDFSPVFKMFSNVVMTTVIASIPTALFSMYAFNQLTLNSVLANIVAVPLMTFFIMPIALTALFLMIFNCAQPLIILFGYGVDVLIKIADYISQLPGSFFIMHTPSVTVMITIVLSGLILTLLHHKIRLVGLGGIACGLLIYAFEPLPDIFVSQDTKVIGIRTDDVVCCNHLGYFRSITSAWAKSVGFEKREKFNSKACRKLISKIDNDTFKINIKNTDVIITNDADTESDKALIFHLNEPRKFAELIYLPSRKTASENDNHRPWS